MNKRNTTPLNFIFFKIWGRFLSSTSQFRGNYVTKIYDGVSHSEDAANWANFINLFSQATVKTLKKNGKCGKV